jgi:hypothetical protein
VNILKTHNKKFILIVIATMIVVGTFATGVSYYYVSKTQASTIVLPIASPPEREAAAMAYDSKTKQTLLFGGLGPLGNVMGGTWLFNGVQWQKETPTNSPSPRAFASLIYDKSTNQMILFGGLIPHSPNATVLNDTWIWNGSNWIQQNPANSPSPRAAAAVSLSPVAHGQSSNQNSNQNSNGEFDVVLFGGLGPNGTTLNDTWIWNGSNWIQQNPTNSPSPRAAAAVSLSPVAHGQSSNQNSNQNSNGEFDVVLFGGLSSLNLVTGELNDTWIWNGSNWIQQNPTNSPSPRAAAAISLSPVAHGQSSNQNSNQNSNGEFDVVLFGGLQGANSLNDTWTWNGKTWTRVLDPKPVNPLYPYPPMSSTTNPPPSPWQNTIWNNPLDPYPINTSPPTIPVAPKLGPEPYATTACTPSELSVGFTDLGPEYGIPLTQAIITISSSSPCILSPGYPNLEYFTSSGTFYPVQVGDGGAAVAPTKPQKINIGDGFVASFLIQSYTGCNAGISSAKFKVPGTSSWIPISLGTKSWDPTGWSACGGKVVVTPFEPGNSFAQYQQS